MVRKLLYIAIFETEMSIDNIFTYSRQVLSFSVLELEIVVIIWMQPSNWLDKTKLISYSWPKINLCISYSWPKRNLGIHVMYIHRRKMCFWSVSLNVSFKDSYWEMRPANELLKKYKVQGWIRAILGPKKDFIRLGEAGHLVEEHRKI